jgi:hypothetical protein
MVDDWFEQAQRLFEQGGGLVVLAVLYVHCAELQQGEALTACVAGASGAGQCDVEAVA